MDRRARAADVCRQMTCGSEPDPCAAQLLHPVGTYQSTAGNTGSDRERIVSVPALIRLYACFVRIFGFEDRLFQLFAERMVCVEIPGHEKIEQIPELAEPVLDRRSRQDKPLPARL